MLFSLATNSSDHPGEGRGPEWSQRWVPAFAGMSGFLVWSKNA
jgi:hypothetical protein